MNFDPKELDRAIRAHDPEAHLIYDAVMREVRRIYFNVEAVPLEYQNYIVLGRGDGAKLLRKLKAM